MKNCDFSYHHYQEILKKALKAGFTITNFCDFDKVSNRSKIMILRHDIDYFPHRALEIAKIEKKLNIQSTFFVRVHGQGYYPFEKENFPYFQEILSFGHEIGLHTEARDLAKLFKTDIFALFQKEKEVLENIFDLKISSAAEHGDILRSPDFWQKPLLTLRNKKQLQIKYIPEDFRDFYYISDSCSHWQKDCVCSSLPDYDKIQLLTHPDHWGEGAKGEMKALIKTICPDNYLQIIRQWKI